MRVKLFPADNGGTGFYRMWAPGWVLQGIGHDISFDYQAKDLKVRVNSYGEVVSVDDPECDVAVFQRPMSKLSPAIITKLQERGIAVVVEVDDDYWSIDPRSLAFKDFAPSINKKANFDILTETCKRADLVTVSTPALSRIIPNRAVRVLRNMVPQDYLGTTPGEFAWGSIEALVGDRLLVGWSGDPMWHVGDLEAAGPYVAKAVRDCGAAFVCLGAEESGPMMGFADGEAYYVPWVVLSEYAQNLANFDVGLVPLRSSAFNESKSYLKGLEYAALGIPFIASPTEEYTLLSGMGVGWSPVGKHGWGRLLTTLLKSEDRRDELIGRGLAFAAKNTYERNCGQWWEAWTLALKNRGRNRV